MRIWYQSLFPSGSAPTYFEGLAERAKTIARAGVDVRFEGMPRDTYGGQAPADVVIYPYLISLHAQFILDNAIRAQSEGYDVFAIGSVQDPALEEARSLIDIPVVAYGEAAMHFACQLGSRFAVLVFQPGFDQMMDRRIRSLGLEARAIPTVLIKAGFGDVGRGLQDPSALIERFSEAARVAIARGAEVIIPGQLYLSEAIARAGLSRVDEAPIVDALSATLKMAEAMGDLHRLGIRVTRRGYTHAKPSADQIAHARRLHHRPDA